VLSWWSDTTTTTRFTLFSFASFSSHKQPKVAVKQKDVPQYAAGGTPAAYVQQVIHLLDYCCIIRCTTWDAAYFHKLWWYTTSCGTSIANSNAAESCIGVRSAAFSCRSHKVRCLHLTVNSQWKITFFTRPGKSCTIRCTTWWCIGVISGRTA